MTQHHPVQIGPTDRPCGHDRGIMGTALNGHVLGIPALFLPYVCVRVSRAE